MKKPKEAFANRLVVVLLAAGVVAVALLVLGLARRPAVAAEKHRPTSVVSERRGHGRAGWRERDEAEEREGLERKGEREEAEVSEEREEAEEHEREEAEEREGHEEHGERGEGAWERQERETAADALAWQRRLVPTPTASWTFDKAPVGKLPAPFESVVAGRGPAGRWVVREAEDAPSKPNVLAQIDPTPAGGRFAIALVPEGKYENFILSVLFKPLLGRIDEAGGLVFRYQDAGDHYILRANALENNVRLYKMVRGRRIKLAGANLRVMSNCWHQLGVRCYESRISVYFDGVQLFEIWDSTYRQAGKVGLWIKADSVTEFDNLVVMALAGEHDRD